MGCRVFRGYVVVGLKAVRWSFIGCGGWGLGVADLLITCWVLSGRSMKIGFRMTLLFSSLVFSGCGYLAGGTGI